MNFQFVNSNILTRHLFYSILMYFYNHPVLSVLTFRTPEEAVAKANNTPFGLSAGIWTEKGSRILWMANQMRAGIVWANTFNRFDPTSPFGGFKESGFGREGGVQGLGAYLNVEDPS